MNNHTVIGITGGSGSGKTSFIRKLKSVFDSSQMCIISQDDYYKPIQEQILDDQGIENFDLPTSIDHKTLVSDIERLKKGQTVIKKEYTFNNDAASAKDIVLNPAPIIIVEGLFILHYADVRNQLDFSLFIQAKENLKIIRRIRRDQMERNYPLEDVLYRYEFHVMSAFEKYIAPYKEQVDIIINNNTTFDRGFEILCGFLSDKLAKIEGYQD